MSRYKQDIANKAVVSDCIGGCKGYAWTNGGQGVPEAIGTDKAMTVRYDVPGSARKALANAIGEAIGAYPAYQAAPTFAYIIGEYTLDRQGILTGPHNADLIGFLAQDGYQTK